MSEPIFDEEPSFDPKVARVCTTCWFVFRDAGASDCPAPDCDATRPGAGWETLGACEIDGRFRLVKWLGAGGMGAVFMAERLDEARRATGERVAIKLARGQRHLAKLAAEALDAEYAAGRSLAREARDAELFIKLGGMDSQRSPPYFTMELLSPPWTTLREFVSRRDAEGRQTLVLLGSLRIARIGERVLKALALMHHKSFIHLDIKPDNIFVAPRADGSIGVKVSDLGSWRAVRQNEDGTTTTQAVGGAAPRPGTSWTATYVAPEQIMEVLAATKGVGLVGEALPPDVFLLTPKADQFALAVTMWQLLVGTAPFTRAPTGEVNTWVARVLEIRAHSAGARKLPGHDDVPSPLREVLLKAMRFSPAERHADVEAMRRELRSAIAHLERRPAEILERIEAMLSRIRAGTMWQELAPRIDELRRAVARLDARAANLRAGGLTDAESDGAIAESEDDLEALATLAQLPIEGAAARVEPRASRALLLISALLLLSVGVNLAILSKL